MTFISHARNFEDVLLHRALAEVEAGFYVDLGATAPQSASATKSFYDLGWSGLVVPSADVAPEAYRSARPRDVVRSVSEPFSLERTLAAIGVSTVHFLRLGGGAHEAVSGAISALDRVRPWIVVAETVEPASEAAKRSPLEEALVDASYRCVWFDGVNRFFLAGERDELAARFGVPPNVFDDFKLERVAVLEASVDAALRAWDERRASIDARIAELDGRIEGQRAEVARVQRERDALEELCLRERRQRLRAMRRLTEAEEQLRREGELLQLMELAARELERTVWARALAEAGPWNELGTLVPRSAVSLRKRLRKARRYLQTHPQLAQKVPSLELWLDAASKMLPEAVTGQRAVVSVKEALGGSSRADAALPRGVWLPPGLRAQAALRRRVRRVRKYLRRNRTVGALLPGAEGFLDEVSELLPREVGEARIGKLTEEIARLRAAWGLDAGLPTARPAVRADASASTRGLPRVLALSTYPCVRPRHGGQVRLANVLEAYRRGGYAVRSLAVYDGESYGPEEVCGLDVAFPPESAFRRYGGRSVPMITDLLSGHYAAADGGGYGVIRSKLAEGADVIHLEQPWLLPLAKRLVSEEPGFRDATVVYGSANIELDLKKSIFGRYGIGDAEDVLLEIDELEREAARWSDLTLAVTESDERRLRELGARRTLHAANGIGAWHATPEALARWRAELPPVPWLLYVASAHPPNFQGFVPCIGDSLACIPPSSRLVIAGTVGPHVERVLSEVRWCELNRSRLHVLGVLDDDDLSAVKTLAHGFVLPLLDGGGSNIKTAEALFSGKHVIATTVSMRGYEAYRTSTRVHIADEPESFRKAVREVLAAPAPTISSEEEALRERLTWERCLADLPREVDRVRLAREAKQ